MTGVQTCALPIYKRIRLHPKDAPGLDRVVEYIVGYGAEGKAQDEAKEAILNVLRVSSTGVAALVAIGKMLESTWNMRILYSEDESLQTFYQFPDDFFGLLDGCL